MFFEDTVWRVPPERVTLAAHEVHCWRASLQQPLSVLERLRGLLCADEVARAERFHFEKDRQHFIVARGLLRELISCYTQIAPGAICFHYNEYGKPSLGTAPGGLKLNFNISHSHELVLYAFTLERQLGIDIEYIRALPDYEQIASHYFSQLEQTTLQALASVERREAFFQCWTRKEAYIKARGRGLSLALNLFDVSLRPGEAAALLDSREDSAEPARWHFSALAPGAGYAAAVAAEGHDWQLCCWQNCAD